MKLNLADTSVDLSVDLSGDPTGEGSAAARSQRPSPWGSRGTVINGRSAALHAFLQVSQDLACALDLVGRFAALGRGWEILGTAVEPTRGLRVVNGIVAADRAAWDAAWDAARRRGEPGECVARWQRGAGEVCWLAWRLMPGPDGQQVWATARPVPPPAEPADLQPLGKVDLLRALFDTAREYGVLALTPEGTIICWSKGAARITGYDEATILGRPMAELHAPESNLTGRSDLSLRLAARNGWVSDEGWLVRCGGNRYWAVVDTTAVRDGDGRLRGFVQTIRDTTERRRFEESVGRSYAVLERRVHDRTEQLMATNDCLQQEIHNREAAERNLRQSRRNLKGQAQQLKATLAKLKAAQTQLVLREKMSGLGRLVGGVAHELNNPVTFILGNLDYARQYTADLLAVVTCCQRYGDQLPPPVQAALADLDVPFLARDLPHLFDSMQNGSERIRTLVLSLRNFARLDESDRKVADLHDGIDNTLLMMGNQLRPPGGRAIAIARHYGEIGPVECYPGALNQAISHIVTNAIEALQQDPTGDGQPPTITIRTRWRDRQFVEIQIADNGAGMDEGVRQKVFDPFFTTKPIGQGVGLGLSICHQIVVQEHGGLIRCHSTPGVGTRLVIVLPLN